MSKSTHFFGQPVYGQLIKALDHDNIVKLSRQNGGERYVKSFDGFTHLLTMLYAVIMRFDSLREIEAAMTAEVRKLQYIGIDRVPKRSTLSGGIKVHSVIHANEGVHCDVKFTSAATNDSFMLAPSHFKHEEIVALDRAYINYEKFEELTERNVVYVTKMKKCLKYEVLADCMDMNGKGLMEYREQVVVFRKGGISHIARIITYVDIKKGKSSKLVSLLTNDFEMPMEKIVAIYRRRWQIESLFKQIKQNFPLRYFYGESANAIKIQIWVTLIANLLLTLLQSSLERRWSFSGLATMVRIVLMEYLNMKKFFNMLDVDMKLMLEAAAESPPGATENY